VRACVRACVRLCLSVSVSVCVGDYHPHSAVEEFPLNFGRRNGPLLRCATSRDRRFNFFIKNNIY